MEQITTNFGFSSTAAEVIEGVDLSGKRATVTGGASGIGLETAKALSLSVRQSRSQYGGQLRHGLLRKHPGFDRSSCHH